MKKSRTDAYRESLRAEDVLFTFKRLHQYTRNRLNPSWNQVMENYLTWRHSLRMNYLISNRDEFCRYERLRDDYLFQYRNPEWKIINKVLIALSISVATLFLYYLIIR